MSKASVLVLVNDLTLGASSDATIIGNYYDRVVEDLARFPWLTTISLVPLTANVSEYVLDTAQAKIIAMFYDGRQLSRLTRTQVEGLNRHWRNEYGIPHSYIVDDEFNKTFALYPIPKLDSKAQTFPHSQPFGQDFPAYTLLVIHTGTRTDLPTWLELPVALEVAARDMERESNHRDLEWAARARTLSQLLFQLVGKP